MTVFFFFLNCDIQVLHKLRGEGNSARDGRHAVIVLAVCGDGALLHWTVSPDGFHAEGVELMNAH